MRKLLYILASAAVAAGGCSEKKEAPAGEGCGTIRIVCEADATIDAASTVPAQSATRAAAKPAGEDFALRITGEDFDRTWETVAAYNAEDTSYSFPEGRYTITVTYGDPEAEGVDKPYYAGSTEVEVASAPHLHRADHGEDRQFAGPGTRHRVVQKILQQRGVLRDDRSGQCLHVPSLRRDRSGIRLGAGR